MFIGNLQRSRRPAQHCDDKRNVLRRKLNHLVTNSFVHFFQLAVVAVLELEKCSTAPFFDSATNWVHIPTPEVSHALTLDDAEFQVSLLILLFNEVWMSRPSTKRPNCPKTTKSSFTVCAGADRFGSRRS